jgi:prepilin-type N-terminal cleavage/methylation domain-containing protein
MSRKGFTLLELTLVLFLIGLILSLTMPRLENFLFQSDLKEVARSLKSTVYTLRSQSISKNIYTTLHFDLDNNLYYGTRGDLLKDLDVSGERSPMVLPKKLPQGVRFLDASNISTPRKQLGVLSSTFNPKGVFEETVLHIADRHQNVMTIIINAYTGGFMLYDEYVTVEYPRE